MGETSMGAALKKTQAVGKKIGQVGRGHLGGIYSVTIQLLQDTNSAECGKEKNKVTQKRECWGAKLDKCATRLWNPLD